MSDDYSYLFDLLSIPDDGSFILSDVCVEGPKKSVTLSRRAAPAFCPQCSSRMHSKGIYTRTLLHPVFQDGSFFTILLKQRRWKCPRCGFQTNERFPFVERYKQSTNLTPLLVLDALKDLQVSTRSVARKFHMSDTQIRNIFSSYVDLKRLSLTEFISIDEVYLNIDDSHKYAFVIMDFASGQIIDIVSNRWTSTLEKYFLSIPREERLLVKGIISDAYKPYLESVPAFFPNACSILDSFHVISFLIRKLNDHLNRMIRARREKLKKEWLKSHPECSDTASSPPDSREIILLRDYRWILLKNYKEINRSGYPKWHQKLRMRVDTASIESMFFAIDPSLRKLHRLKEEYLAFNDAFYPTTEEASKTLEALIQKYKRSDQRVFVEFAQFLKAHKKEIALSFTVAEVSRKGSKDLETYYARLSNGPMESFNRKPKDYKKNARGTSNFDYIRNLILWAERKDPSVSFKQN